MEILTACERNCQGSEFIHRQGREVRLPKNIRKYQFFLPVVRLTFHQWMKIVRWPDVKKSRFGVVAINGFRYTARR